MIPKAKVSLEDIDRFERKEMINDMVNSRLLLENSFIKCYNWLINHVF